MKPKVYLETSVISYLTSRPSREVIVAAHQLITKDWWEKRRAEFELFASPIVHKEAGKGDADAAARRLEVLEGIPLIELTVPAAAVARDILTQIPLPANAEADALHIGLAVAGGMDYLLTWNCTHIANAALWPKIEAVC